ncbi:MAG: peptidoglycan editing factor PgeF [Lachnospiraceae bacterium]|nr:peptidoglycan editing factor PgeF [Lachnospiraceae bacterium]
MIKYFKCESLEKTGLVKTAYTSNNSEARWKIYSKDPSHFCMKYYEEMASMMGIKVDDMVRIPQKHTTNIKIVKKGDGGLGISRQEDEGYIDGMITDEKGIMLCTVEADCIPVYMLDPKNKAIGMIHSGWRGTAGLISIKALDMMKKEYNTDIKDILIYLGPSICKDCYEVRDDVIDEFSKIFDDKEIKDIYSIKEDSDISDRKYNIDVKLALKKTLWRHGIKKENIEESIYCTYHNVDLFDSYRRTKDVGHILTCIMLV